MTTLKPPLPTVTWERARRLRREMTDAEQRIWMHLRGGRFLGLKFRRQHPVPPYIADFCCVEKKLIIELEGSRHGAEVDAARTRYLESQGWRVVRFDDYDALTQTESVLDAIWNIVSAPDPHPNPSPDGRGARAETE